MWSSRWHEDNLRKQHLLGFPGGMVPTSDHVPLEPLDSSHPAMRVSFEFPDKDDPGLRDRLTAQVQEAARNIKSIAEPALQSSCAAVAAQH
jgi:hypothetical protein